MDRTAVTNTPKNYFSDFRTNPEKLLYICADYCGITDFPKIVAGT